MTNEYEWSFTAELNSSYIENVAKLLGVDADIDTGNPTVYVEYELEPEVRKYGIKGFMFNEKRTQCSIEWETEASELSEEEKAILIAAGGTEYRNGTIGGVIEVDTLTQEWEVKNEATFESDGAFSLSDATIDVFEKTITLS